MAPRADDPAQVRLEHAAPRPCRRQAMSAPSRNDAQARAPRPGQPGRIRTSQPSPLPAAQAGRQPRSARGGSTSRPGHRGTAAARRRDLLGRDSRWPGLRRDAALAEGDRAERGEQPQPDGQDVGHAEPGRARRRPGRSAAARCARRCRRRSAAQTLGPGLRVRHERPGDQAEQRHPGQHRSWPVARRTRAPGPRRPPRRRPGPGWSRGTRPTGRWSPSPGPGPRRACRPATKNVHDHACPRTGAPRGEERTARRPPRRPCRSR